MWASITWKGWLLAGSPGYEPTEGMTGSKADDGAVWGRGWAAGEILLLDYSDVQWDEAGPAGRNRRRKLTVGRSRSGSSEGPRRRSCRTILHSAHAGILEMKRKERRKTQLRLKLFIWFIVLNWLIISYFNNPLIIECWSPLIISVNDQ